MHLPSRNLIITLKRVQNIHDKIGKVTKTQCQIEENIISGLDRNLNQNKIFPGQDWMSKFYALVSQLDGHWAKRSSNKVKAQAHIE